MKKLFKQIWNDESAQGMSEYILLLVVVIAVAVIFKDKIKSAVEGKVSEVSGSISDFK